MMDRWHIEVSEQTGTHENGEDVADKIPYNIVNNYFSIGVVSTVLSCRVCEILRKKKKYVPDK